MVSADEFDKLKKRVADLEQIMAEMPKAFQGLLQVVGAHGAIVEKMPAFIDQMSTLVAMVEKLQAKLDPTA